MSEAAIPSRSMQPPEQEEVPESAQCFCGTRKVSSCPMCDAGLCRDCADPVGCESCGRALVCSACLGEFEGAKYCKPHREIEGKLAQPDSLRLAMAKVHFLEQWRPMVREARC